MDYFDVVSKGYGYYEFISEFGDPGPALVDDSVETLQGFMFKIKGE